MTTTNEAVRATEGRKLLNETLTRTGLQQREVAMLAGVAQTTVSRWCRGYDRPRIHQRELLSGALGIPCESWETTDVSLLAANLAERDIEGRHRLNEAMDRAGLTQEALGRVLGVRQPNVSTWCRGIGCPSRRHREALEALLGIPRGSWALRGQPAPAVEPAPLLVA